MSQKNSEYKTKLSSVVKKLTPQNIGKGLRYLRYYGVRQFVGRLQDRFTPEEVDYMQWRKQHQATEAQLQQQKAYSFEKNRKFSIVVPAYNTNRDMLLQLIDSVLAQTYANWELCIADGSGDPHIVGDVVREAAKKDGRIRYEHLKENLGIAQNTNAALAMATGEYIGLLDHDDLLEPDALYWIAREIEADENLEMIYTDEDKVSEDLKEYMMPNLKPDFNLDLLRSNNYICHFTVVKQSLVSSVGGFSSDYDGAQDYDFFLKCSEKAKKIGHVAKVLYHWRTSNASTSDNPQSKMYAFDAGKRALQAHLLRVNQPGEVEHAHALGYYQIKYPVVKEELVSILIPNKDSVETLKTCLDSIVEKKAYENYEIIIIENNSTDANTFAFYEKIQKENPKIRVVEWKAKEGGFNYSAINNFGAEHARGNYYILLNNDTKIISEDWICQLLGMCQRPEVGIVGVKLYYPDNTIQHAGTIVGIGGVAGHVFINMSRNRSGYMHKASIIQDLSAVTAACLMIKKEAFEKVHGFEENLAVAFNDVDLCIRTVSAGYLVVYDPYVEVYHYESKSRGLEDNKEKVRRFKEEIEFMKTRHREFLEKGDPCYNPNLTLKKSNYSLKV